MHKPVDTTLLQGLPPTALELHALRRLLNNYDETLAGFKLTVTDWLLLELLERHPNGTRMTECALAVGVELPLITRLVQTHTAAGLVKVTQDASDRRAKLVTLARRGEVLTAQITSELVAASERCYGVLSDRQKQVYYRLLTQILHRAGKL